MFERFDSKEEYLGEQSPELIASQTISKVFERNLSNTADFDIQVADVAYYPEDDLNKWKSGSNNEIIVERVVLDVQPKPFLSGVRIFEEQLHRIFTQDDACEEILRKVAIANLLSTELKAKGFTPDRDKAFYSLNDIFQVLGENTRLTPRLLANYIQTMPLTPDLLERLLEPVPNLRVDFRIVAKIVEWPQAAQHELNMYKQVRNLGVRTLAALRTFSIHYPLGFPNDKVGNSYSYTYRYTNFDIARESSVILRSDGLTLFMRGCFDGFAKLHANHFIHNDLHFRNLALVPKGNYEHSTVIFDLTQTQKYKDIDSFILNYENEVRFFRDSLREKLKLGRSYDLTDDERALIHEYFEKYKNIVRQGFTSKEYEERILPLINRYWDF